MTPWFARSLGFFCRMASLGWCCAAAATVAAAAAAPPTVTHLFPAGGQRGTTCQVKCNGTFDWPLLVWAPGLQVVATAEKGVLEITVPPDLIADRVWLRLYNSSGTSACLPFLIGNAPEVAEKEPNNRLAEAQQLNGSRGTINGVLEGRGVDTYQLDVQAGETLVADLDAEKQLGSPMDAMLQLVSSDGVVLAENNDCHQLDPCVVWTAPRAGKVAVRVFAFSSQPNTTIAYGGEETYVYRLTWTTGIHAAHPWPLAVERGSSPAVGLLGWNLPAQSTSDAAESKVPAADRPATPSKPLRAGAMFPLAPSSVGLSEEWEATDISKLIQHRWLFVAAPEFAKPWRVREVPMPCATEDQLPWVTHEAAFHGKASQESAPAAESHTADARQGHEPGVRAVSLPAAISGTLANRSEIDRFALQLEKDQTIAVAAESQQFDGDMDLELQVWGPDGTRVAQADDVGDRRDAYLTFVASAAGAYILQVRDQFAQGKGTRPQPYLLTIYAELPDFELSVAADQFTGGGETPLEIPVQVLRRGPAERLGAIRIRCEGLPAGVTADEVISEPTVETAAAVKLILPAKSAAFAGPIRIVGESAAPLSLSRAARTPARWGARHETLWLTLPSATTAQ